MHSALISSFPPFLPPSHPIPLPTSPPSLSQRVDVVLVSGDIANKPVQYGSPNEENTRYHAHLEEVVQLLSSVNETLYYVPGNVSGSVCCRDVCLSGMCLHIIYQE